MTRPISRPAAPFAVAATLCLGLALAALPAAAQEDAPDRRFDLQLNTVEDVGETCRLTYVALNETGVALEQTAYDVVVFDAGGAVTSRLILEFGRLPEGKTKVVQFDIDSGGCAGISRLLLNDVEQCDTAEGSVTYCLDALATSSRVDGIEFGA